MNDPLPQFCLNGELSLVNKLKMTSLQNAVVANKTSISTKWNTTGIYK